MVYLRVGEDHIAFEEELLIETDGKRLYFKSGEVECEREYKSVLEILCIMMWLMKHVKKTTVHFTDGTQEFVRKREYNGYKDTLRL